MPVESGNRAIKDGTLGAVMQRAAERWKPEAMDFTTYRELGADRGRGRADADSGQTAPGLAARGQRRDDGRLRGGKLQLLSGATPPQRDDTGGTPADL
jgi:hypothetical protein